MKYLKAYLFLEIPVFGTIFQYPEEKADGFRVFRAAAMVLFIFVHLYRKQPAKSLQCAEYQC